MMTIASYPVALISSYVTVVKQAIHPHSLRETHIYRHNSIASNKPTTWRRYQIQYTVSDISGASAVPLTVNITFVEVAFVTVGFFFVGQADSVSQAEQHAAQLYTAGTASNAALTADLATVLQTWLASATSSYVYQMSLALDGSAGLTAAVDVLELGLFSTILQADVTVLSASIDWDLTSALNFSTSSATQNYAYNVTVQVAVLTSDMLLSVFVDVLSSPPSSRRRLLSNSDCSLLPSIESPLSMQTRSAPVAVSNPSTSSVVALSRRRTLQQSSSRTARMAVFGTAWDDSHAKARSLITTGSSSAFPLSSLLAFKTDLAQAAFAAVSGCSTDSLTDLFFENSTTSGALSNLCVGDNGPADLSLNQALFMSASDSVPLLQVCSCSLWRACLPGCCEV